MPPSDRRDREHAGHDDHAMHNHAARHAHMIGNERGEPAENVVTPEQTVLHGSPGAAEAADEGHAHDATTEGSPHAGAHGNGPQ